MKSDLFKHIKQDAPAGLVVFLVAVPLCLGISLVSGAPLFSGIIAGMVGGIIVTLFSGSQLGVSGPAAGLAIIVLGAITKFGAFDVFLAAVVIAGVLQIALGFLKAGVIAYFFPTSVIKGMLAAIGIIIFIKQIPHALGDDRDPEGELAFQQIDGQTTSSELWSMFDYITPGAVLVTAISLAILILWERPFMKKIKAFQIIQGPLVVVVIGIILGKLFLGSNLEITAEHMVSIPVPADFNGFVGQFTTPNLAAFGRLDVWLTGGIIALVASIETLLCVEATDKLDPQKRITPTNKELVAQGIGNLTSGLIGGLPVTQVIVRSSANIQSGGKTKASALIHGFLILLSAMLIPNILNMIPYASLAGILFVVGFKLAKPSLFKQMYNEGMQQFIPFVVTIVAIYFTDLLIGIGIGLGVGLIFVFRSNYHSAFTLVKKDNQVLIRFNKDVNFIHKAEIMKALSQVPKNSKLIIDGAKAWFIDHDVNEMIEDFTVTAKNRNIETELIHFTNRKASRTK